MSLFVNKCHPAYFVTDCKKEMGVFFVKKTPLFILPIRGRYVLIDIICLIHMYAKKNLCRFVYIHQILKYVLM